MEKRLRVRPFRIEYRKPKPLPRRLVVLTLESTAPFSEMRVKTPEDQVKGWRGLLDWVKYVEADAFWVLAGQTPGEKPGETWVSYNLHVLPSLVVRQTRTDPVKIVFGSPGSIVM